MSRIDGETKKQRERERERKRIDFHWRQVEKDAMYSHTITAAHTYVIVMHI